MAAYVHLRYYAGVLSPIKSSLVIASLELSTLLSVDFRQLFLLSLPTIHLPLCCPNVF